MGSSQMVDKTVDGPGAQPGPIHSRNRAMVPLVRLDRKGVRAYLRAMPLSLPGDGVSTKGSV